MLIVITTQKKVGYNSYYNDYKDFVHLANILGCLLCKTQRGCDFNKFKLERLDIKNELNMRKKAITDKNFPDEELINEFLDRKDNISELNLKWGKPDLINFIVSCSR